jgi:hypothetical protein
VETLPTDTRQHQAARVTKVISDMPGLGYGIGRAWRWCDVSCAGDGRSRMVRIYTLTSRPDTQPDLFTPLCKPTSPLI